MTTVSGRYGVEMAQMEWPHLYRVYLRDVADQHRAEYTVLSWLGGHKAVAMAVEEHCRQPEAWSVYDVQALDIGPAPRQPDGTVGQGPAGYLEDRAEF
jgi:1,2-phenylacetyl-CoA epoxidase PaaB subunit